MNRAVLSALLSHWLRKPVQLAALIVGLAAATALWSGVQAINTEARASYARAADAIGGDRPALEKDGGLTVADFVALRRAGWMVTPLVEGWIDADGTRVRLIGIDPLTAPAELAAAGGQALGGDLAAFVAPPGRLVAAPDTAAALRSVAGLPPVTAAPDLSPGIALADIGSAQRLLGTDALSRLLVLEDQPLRRPPLDAFPGLVQTRTDTADDLARLTDSFHLNLTAFGFLSFAVGLFIVHAAIGLAFEQRRPMLRTLRALGVPAWRLTALVAVELLVLAAVAGLIGVALGYGIAAALLPDVAATLRGLYGVPVAGALSIRASWWAAGLGIAVLGTAAAAASTLWKILRLPVLAAARPRAWARAGTRTAWLQGTAAVLFGATALLLALFGSGLVAGFALLGALLLAAALALPGLLSLAVGALGHLSRGPLSQWFWADTRQQLPGLSLALMALLLALGANIGVGTMVASFRLTFTGWLDQRLAAELYVEARDEAEAARLRDWLAPRTDAVLPIWHVERAILGRPGEIYGVADHATYRDHWPLLQALPDVWDRVAAGEAVLVNEQLARRANLAPGEPIALPDWEAVVGGVYSDYGNPAGQVLVSLATLTERFPLVERLRFGLRVPPEDAPALARALVDEFGLPADAITEQARIKAFSLSVFERTFAVTAALNVLTLAVAGVAILTSLLTLSAMRLAQLAPVWAIGLTRRRLAWLELLRTCLLAALTFVVAVPVGLMLAWALLAVVNVEAFGWRLPMHLFPADWARLGALALGAAALAALWPAWRLTRLDPSSLVRIFSHER